MRLTEGSVHGLALAGACCDGEGGAQQQGDGYRVVTTHGGYAEG